MSDFKTCNFLFPIIRAIHNDKKLDNQEARGVQLCKQTGGRAGYKGGEGGEVGCTTNNDLLFYQRKEGGGGG